MKLIVARHGQTTFNELNIINGQADEPLSSEGRKSIPQLVKKLEHEPLDAVYASPLQRAKDTASPIAKDHGLELKLDKRLMEVDPGSFSGKTYESTIKYYGKMSSDVLSTYNYDFTKFGGETSTQVEARVRSFLEELSKESYKCVLIVTHGGVLRWIYYILDGKKVGRNPNLSVHYFNL